jgi:hypothetical protein
MIEISVQFCASRWQSFSAYYSYSLRVSFIDSWLQVAPQIYILAARDRPILIYNRTITDRAPALILE